MHALSLQVVTLKKHWLARPPFVPLKAGYSEIEKIVHIFRQKIREFCQWNLPWQMCDVEEIQIFSYAPIEAIKKNGWKIRQWVCYESPQ